jgi:hypothetical protein
MIKLFLYGKGSLGDSCSPICADEIDRDYFDTDAGDTSGFPIFVVQAKSQESARDGARRWLACWENEDEPSVPDDLSLVERRTRKVLTHMILLVS